MKDDIFPQVTLHRLHALSESPRLPTRAREQANRLLDRLQSAVRVVLLGPQGVGKSDLLRALIRENVETDPEAPTVLRHVSRAEKPLAEDGLRNAVFADPALENLEFVDVPFPSEPRRQAAVMGWALGQADVVIWCTQTFGGGEAPFWAGVPDQLKDHSFLVLTRARELIQRGVIDERLGALRSIAEEEFHSLFTVETAPVRACLHRAERVDSQMDSDSGIAALRNALLNLAETGRSAWEDAALLLLGRFNGTLAPQLPEPGAQAAKTPNSVPAPQAVPPESVPAPDDPVASCLEYIETRSAELSVADGDNEAARVVLDHCLETCEQIAANLAGATGSGSDFPKFQDDIALAADKMLLIAMEDGIGAAADSVTILLQIRRELEIRQAA